MYRVYSLQHSAEHHMLAIEMGSLNSGDEKLRAVGICACISHREKTDGVVLVLEVFI